MRFIWDWPQIQIICEIRIFNCISHIKLSFIKKTFSTAISTTKAPVFPHKMCLKPHNLNDRKLITTYRYRYMTVSHYSTVEVRTGVSNVFRSGVNPASVYPVCDHSLYRLWAAYYQCNLIFYWTPLIPLLNSKISFFYRILKFWIFKIPIIEVPH